MNTAESTGLSVSVSISLRGFFLCRVQAGQCSLVLSILLRVKALGHIKVRAHAALQRVGANMAEQGIERIALWPACLVGQVRGQVEQRHLVRMQTG